MKDQYFGDINDYRKYGLLRSIIAEAPLRLGVCWMLTAPDNRTDGRHISYLSKPAKYRPFDPVLFDWLCEARSLGDRRIARIETSGLLGSAAFFSEPVVDGREHRRTWFERCRQLLGGSDLVFFDPDNGLERSVRYGSRHSPKFLYWDEVREMFLCGSSVLVYQHFPREPRVGFEQRLSQKLQEVTGSAALFSFSTPYVLFLLAAHRRQADSFRAVALKLPRNWPGNQIAAKYLTRD